MDQAQPLDQAHDSVDDSAHVIRRESSNEVVKGWGSWANAKEYRYFHEYEGEARESAPNLAAESDMIRVAVTYMHRIPNNIMILTWNKLEMPTARQRSIHITPILSPLSAEVHSIVG